MLARGWCDAMRLLIINPNTTASMTETVAIAARGVARQPDHVVAINPDTGPAAIQGAEDGARALPGLFAVFEREVLSGDRFDGVIIACFDDTGLWELRARSSVPVVGIGEAGYHAAALLGPRFSVVTTLAVSIPVLEENIRRYGFADRCARVRASGVPVLDIEGDEQRSRALIEAEVARAFGEDDVASVVLGCAGMANLADELTRRFNRPVIDGVSAAVGLCETLHRATSPLRS
jgi:allantoin racemase